jgi:hypothetical protein
LEQWPGLLEAWLRAHGLLSGKAESGKP